MASSCWGAPIPTRVTPSSTQALCVWQVAVPHWAPSQRPQGSSFARMPRSISTPRALPPVCIPAAPSPWWPLARFRARAPSSTTLFPPHALSLWAPALPKAPPSFQAPSAISQPWALWEYCARALEAPFTSPDSTPIPAPRSFRAAPRLEPRSSPTAASPAPSAPPATPPPTSSSTAAPCFTPAASPPDLPSPRRPPPWPSTATSPWRATPSLTLPEATPARMPLQGPTTTPLWCSQALEPSPLRERAHAPSRSPVPRKATTKST